MIPPNALVLTDFFTINFPRLGKGIRVGAKMKSCLRYGKNRGVAKCPKGYCRDPTNDEPQRPQKTRVDKSLARRSDTAQGQGPSMKANPEMGEAEGEKFHI